MSYKNFPSRFPYLPCFTFTLCHDCLLLTYTFITYKRKQTNRSQKMRYNIHCKEISRGEKNDRNGDKLDVRPCLFRVWECNSMLSQHSNGLQGCNLQHSQNNSKHYDTNCKYSKFLNIFHTKHFLKAHAVPPHSTRQKHMLKYW